MNNTLAPLSELHDAITQRRRKALRHREDISLLKSILSTVVLLAAAVILFNLFFGFRIVSGSDMFPSFCDGDLTLCYRADSLKKNDVIFYEAEGETCCGRVVAKGGDRVFISEGGALIVNGTVQGDEIIYPTYPRGGEDLTVEVPENAVFVLGDFRTEARDSRDFGCIPLNNVEKKVIAVVRHRKL